MATLLYRLGRFSYRRAYTVIGVWLLLFVGILGGGIALGGKTQESFDIPGTESQDALDRLAAVFPQVAGASAQAIMVAPKGSLVTDPAYVAIIADEVAALKKIDGIDSVTGPFDKYAGNAVSADKTAARVQIQFTTTSNKVAPATVTALKATGTAPRDANMVVEFGGQVFQNNTFGITVTEVFGVIFAGVVLLITFGSLLAAGMPLVSALVGVGIVIGSITAISAFTSVSSSAPLLALMIGLAVGIDYSLFILSRHRNQLARGDDPEESAATAVGTAGTAVVFAGITVIIALLGLLVVGIPFLSVMGVGAAVAVLVAIGVATTLLPAILGLVKGRLAPMPGSRAARRAAAHDDPRAKPTLGLRWVSLVMKAPVIATLGVMAILSGLAIPALSLDLNLPDGGSQPAQSTQRKAYDLVSTTFGAGVNGPLVVAIDITQTTAIVDDLKKIGDRLATLPDVKSVSQGAPDAGLDTAIIQVTPNSAPDSPKTKALVQAIRDLAPEIKKQYGTALSVTGATAIGIDISNRLSSALVPFGLIVVGLSIILLMMVFRSVLVPIKAAVGFLLSVVASFGVVVGIFQWGWFNELLNVEKTGPILSFMPILLMAVLFGLAMDYEVFLVSGMREEFVKTGNARTAVRAGFGNGARVVTAAALIMFFVFFAFVPEGSGTIKPIALGLAVGIAFDAFLVRMTLVPAVMTLLGRSAWWLPKWLARVLPDLDIEGEKLREHRLESVWAEGETGRAEPAVLSAQELVVGTDARTVGPLSLRVSAGTVVLASGDLHDRRVLAATLAGYLEPLSGWAQVAGHPVPSEMAAVRHLVAVADVARDDRGETRGTLGVLLTERAALTQPWYRALRVKRQVDRLLEQANQALDEDVAVSVSTRSQPEVERSGTATGTASGTGSRSQLSRDSVLVSLPHLERAVVLALVALAEATPVVMLDRVDSFLVRGDERRFLAAIVALTPPQTVLIVGLAAADSARTLWMGKLRPVMTLAPDKVTAAPDHHLSTLILEAEGRSL
ncbi:MAG: MMPL family transporter [Microbacteriaceae bacterium]|nr:MMPL family transporter [Microbacteriaceae bacterium]